MHRKRRWCVGPAASPEDLAEKLTNHTWTLCAGFYVEGHPDYLFLNDATHEDGALEIAVIHGGLDAIEHRQVESITFSWMDARQALAHIRATLAGEYDAHDFAHSVDLQRRLDRPVAHGRCHFCA